MKFWLGIVDRGSMISNALQFLGFKKVEVWVLENPDNIGSLIGRIVKEGAKSYFHTHILDVAPTEPDETEPEEIDVQEYEYQTTSGFEGEFRDGIYTYEADNPKPPEGPGWEYMDSSATPQRICWFWRRRKA